jgi:hypothetical protein
MPPQPEEEDIYEYFQAEDSANGNGKAPSAAKSAEDGNSAPIPRP